MLRLPKADSNILSGGDPAVLIWNGLGIENILRQGTLNVSVREIVVTEACRVGDKWLMIYYLP